MRDIIQFYQRFDRFSKASYKELYDRLLQPWTLGQYKEFRNPGCDIWGFANWAWVDADTEQRFLETGKLDDWNCGNILLHIDLLAKRDVPHIMGWLRNSSHEKVGVGREIHWLRTDSKNIRTVVSRTVKESWA